MEQNERNNNKLHLLTGIKKVTIAISITVLSLIVILICIVVLLYKSCNTSFKTDTQIKLSPTMITYLEDIGQWEFLSIADEELVDTVRYGFFGDDSLVRIYYGTLRLGINMKDVKKNWIYLDDDTVFAVLPPIRLLDDNFIDEARTSSFYEQGSWSSKDYAAMYEKAKRQMKERCINNENIDCANENATKQFFHLLTSMGFKHIKVTIGQSKN